MNVSYNEMAKVAVRKSLLKEYSVKDGFSYGKNFNVYMGDGTEFELQLFNPTDCVLGVEISVNGDEMSNLLVLRPGERVWLERFLDSPEKFLFSTYEVSDTDAVREAIRNNGVIDVRFYKEEHRISGFQPINLGTFRTNTFDTFDTYYTFSSLTTNTAPTSLYSVNLQANEPVKEQPCDEPLMCSASLETGRVERGGSSSQRFDNVYYNFSSWPFYSKTINILPESQRQYTSDDLKKNFCTECGKKLKSGYKFCPNCGAKV